MTKASKCLDVMALWIMRTFIIGFLGLGLYFVCIFGKDMDVFGRGLKIGAPIILKGDDCSVNEMSVNICVYVEQFDVKSGLASVAVSLQGSIPTNSECAVYRDAVCSNNQDVVYCVEYLDGPRHLLHGADAIKLSKLFAQDTTPRYYSVSSISTETQPMRMDIPLYSDTCKYPFDRYEFHESFHVSIQKVQTQQKMSIPVTGRVYMLDNHLLGSGWNLQFVKYKEKNGIGGGRVVTLVRSQYIQVLTIIVLIIAGILTLVVMWVVQFASRQDCSSGWNPTITVSTCVFAMFALRSFVTPSDVTSFTLFDGAVVMLAFLQVISLSVKLFGKRQFIGAVDDGQSTLKKGSETNKATDVMSKGITSGECGHSSMATDVSEKKSDNPEGIGKVEGVRTEMHPCKSNHSKISKRGHSASSKMRR